MELTSVKLLVMTLSGVVRIFFGMFPLVVVKTLMKKWSRATDNKIKKVISVLMFFGGGVLLATCFLHMLPEVREKLSKEAPDLGIPLTEVIFLAGFFLVYLIEDIVHSIVHKKLHDKKEAKKGSNQNGKAITGSEHLNENTLGFNKRNLALSCGTLTNGDKGLCNDQDADDGDSGVIITCNNAPAGGGSNSVAVLPPTQLSLSNGNQINPNHLRETREIFRKISLNDEIPGLAKNRGQNGMGGITNGGYVSSPSEKFQYNDPDWWKDIVNSNAGGNANNSQIDLIREANCTVAPCANGIQESNLNSKDNNNSSSHRKSNSKNIAHNRGCKNQVQKMQIDSSGSNDEDFHHKHKHHHHHDQNGHSHMHLPMMDPTSVDESIGGEIRNILIVIAISFHGVFEGMAIGLQATEMDVWYLFLAVSLHECTILFCIGVELISSKTKVFRMILYILIVSLVCPVGIAIGIVVTEKPFGNSVHQTLIVGCFQGLAAGTLLYVTFFEIFQEEGRKLHRKFYHILVAILGFLLMGSLEFMGGHSHGGHSHGAGRNGSIIEDPHDHSDHSHEGHAPTGHVEEGHNHTHHDHHHDHVHSH